MIPKEGHEYLPLLESMLKKQPDDRPDLDKIIAELKRIASGLH